MDNPIPRGLDYSLIPIDALLGMIETAAREYPEQDLIMRSQTAAEVEEHLKALYIKRALVMDGPDSRSVKLEYHEDHGKTIVTGAITEGRTLSPACQRMNSRLGEIMKKHPAIFQENFPRESLQRWMKDAYDLVVRMDSRKR